jgi:GTP-binding protein EngB required for normal cell division
MMEIDIENFDYDDELRKIRELITKPNILITGATGAGKSSLVNRLFGEKTAKVGEGRPITEGIHPYFSENLNVNLYDSEGYEVNSDENWRYRSTVLGFVDERIEGGDIEQKIHEVWHCVSAAGKRVTDMDIDIINEIGKRKIPVAIVFTQIDCVDADELAAVTKRAEEACPGVAHFNICCLDDEALQERLKEHSQQSALLDWAMENLDEALREGFVSPLEGALDRKRDIAEEKIVPMYTAIAAGIGAAPLPFAADLRRDRLKSALKRHAKQMNEWLENYVADVSARLSGETPAKKSQPGETSEKYALAVEIPKVLGRALEVVS